ncbi:ParB/RepB/Spo0J family partition protein [Streptomyces sp. MP131-18]|uniref:ParB/RepB/Spo0J family partition protein n=1 Tax=Streptomyces sp. MP131-18 TaxID=1857892 RepID=UPI0009A14AEF|nr:ParB/RepB/Spo0J family partition protein [Streptomyces sp. MP131-18]ONK15815.1 hypothetical protein STBA_66560 [Streptomyces sp. MP131-18]
MAVRASIEKELHSFPQRQAALVPATDEDRVTTVPIGSLVAGRSPRSAGVDPDHVRLLAGIEEALPPIQVHRRTMTVIDGMHRLHAALLNGRSTIRVEYFDGSERAAFVRAVEANTGHGLPLTLGDRKESARTLLLLYREWSDSAVATKVGLSAKTVAALRRDLAGDGQHPGARTGRDGRVRPLNCAEGRMKADALFTENPAASLREVARAAGVSLGTARDVRARRDRGESPVPSGRPPRRSRHARAPGQENTETVDCAAVLESLRRDPALKYTEHGRLLLRWLDTRALREHEVDYAARVPAHRCAAVALTARTCAALWERIAVQLEARGEESPAE